MEDIDADVLEAKLHEAHNCGVGHPTYAMALDGGGGGETRPTKRWLRRRRLAQKILQTVRSRPRAARCVV